MNRINFKWIPVLLIITGCSTARELYLTKTQDQKTPERNTFMYSLPRTVINIEVEIQKSVFIPGPYHEYATRFLAIEGIRHDHDVSWNIKKIRLFASEEPDPDYYFSAEPDVDFRKFLEEVNLLSQSGQIIIPGSFVIKDPVTTEINIPEEHEIYFKDLTDKRNLITVKETTYKRIFRDSVYVQVPIVTESLEEKKPELKAEEAANFIIKLRKRRFKLLTGQNEGDVPDESIASVIDELSRIEKEYLSLFTGKTVFESETLHFNYIPVPGKTTDQQILFKLSESEGIFDAMSPKGEPVVFEIECLDLTRNLKEMRTSEAVNTLFYREPDLARIIISFDDERLSENRLTVYQYGTMVSRKMMNR